MIWRSKLNKINLCLSILMFMQFVIWGAWFVTLGNYMLNSLNMNGHHVGLAYGTTAIAAIITPFLAGRLADQWFSIEKMLFALHLSGGIIMYILSFATEFKILYPLLLLYTFLYLPTFALTNSITFRYTNNTKDFTRIRVWGAIGWIFIGFVVGGLELEYTKTPMQISAGASLLQAFYCLTLPHTAPDGSTTGQRTILSPELLKILGRPSFITLIIGLTLTCIPSAFYYSFTNAFLNEVGIGNAAGLMSFGQISEVIFMLLLPLFLLKFGIRNVLLLGTLCWSVRYALFALDGQGQMAYPLYGGVLLHGIAFNFTFLLGQIYTDRCVPAHLRSTAQGFITLVTLGFGVLLGSVIAGFVVNHHLSEEGLRDWETIWWYPSAVGMFAFLLLFIFFKEEEKGGLLSS